MLRLVDVAKTFRKGTQHIQAVRGISWELKPGTFAVVHGKSGSGKSTLLMMIGGMLTPSGGRVYFRDRDLYAGGGAARRLYRRRSVGFIFQRFHLLPYFHIPDNIALSLSMRGIAPRGAAIAGMARDLGLENRIRHFPSELSAGEQQRVALAQALAGTPDVILADEPTGNLDADNAALINAQLRQAADAGRIVIAATHDARLLDNADLRLHLADGRMAEDGTGKGCAPCGH